jgi:Tfp pilus assembly protein PilF
VLDLKIVALDYVLLNDYADADHWIRYSLSVDPNDAEAWYEAGRRIVHTFNYFRHALNASPGHAGTGTVIAVYCH